VFRSLDPDQIVDYLRGLTRQWTPDWHCTGGTKGVTIHLLEQIVGDKAGRQAVLAHVFRDGKQDQMSASELTDSEWYALVSWVQPYKDHHEGWTVGQYVIPQALALLSAAQINRAGVAHGTIVT